MAPIKRAENVVNVDFAPCHYHIGTSGSHVGSKEYYHSGT